MPTETAVRKVSTLRQLGGELENRGREERTHE
jgi:hypothetical protein